MAPAPKLKRTFQSCVALALCASCSVHIPQSTVTYIDEESGEKNEWPTITDETEDYRLSLEALHNVDDALVFDIGILNKNLDSLYIDPNAWKMTYATNYFEGWVGMDSLSAMSSSEISETYAQLADKYETAQNKEKAAVIIIGSILVIGLLVAIASIDGDGEDDEDCCCDDDVWVDMGFIANVSNDQTDTHSLDEISILRNNARHFQNSPQVPLYLQKGEEAWFDVFFKRMPQMGVFKLQWNFNHQNFEWTFLHEVSAE